MEEAISIPRNEISIDITDNGLKVLSDENEFSKLQQSINEAIKGIWKSMNVKYDSRELNKLSQAFAEEIAKYDPETIGIVINKLPELNNYLPTRINADMFKLADTLLPDIHLQRMYSQFKKNT
ncbi:MAG: hypothetical protein KatS3mg003_1869 [Candidatus Nitrosocaldaceae archaeon]|nr:MAG: hypothetical protein KatS3mg003_1869 [Candidatus Nitrosocaldaceae archaeon]